MRELEEEFIGRGEVKGFHFKLVEKTPYGYIYKVTPDKKLQYYEIIKRVENQMYDKVSYPGSKSFGYYGKTTRNLEKAKEILKSYANH